MDSTVLGPSFGLSVMLVRRTAVAVFHSVLSSFFSTILLSILAVEELLFCVRCDLYVVPADSWCHCSRDDGREKV